MEASVKRLESATRLTARGSVPSGAARFRPFLSVPDAAFAWAPDLALNPAAREGVAASAAKGGLDYSG